MSLEKLQERVDGATVQQLINDLQVVVGWQVFPFRPETGMRRSEAQYWLDRLQADASKPAITGAKRWLHKTVTGFQELAERSFGG